ncbi:YihY/virulence factor BrkB family protein [bacterium]|nr:YihY/virulence factor BrkB family protein [bacterium]
MNFSPKGFGEKLRHICRFWLLVLADVIRNFIRDDCAFLASGIAFYALLSLFPMCLSLVSFFGWVFSIDWIHQQVILGLSRVSNAELTELDGLAYTIGLIQQLMPATSEWIEQELSVLADHIGRNVIISIILGLWSGRHMFVSMEMSLNKVWNITNRRNWFSSNLVSMYLILVTGLAFVVLLTFTGLMSLVENVISSFSLPTFLGFSFDQAMIWSWLVSWVMVPLGASALFLMMYRLLPAEALPVSYLIPGALFSGITWKLSSLAYLEYGIRFGQVSAFYGSIWYLIGLMTWLYVVAIVFLLGAEVVYAYAYQQELRSGKRILPQ